MASARTKVALVGYGVIGRRVADAIAVQEDMELTGVADVAADWRIRQAAAQGFPLFAAARDAERPMKDAGLELAGGLEDLVEAADIVVDCTPKGFGARNAGTYRRIGK